VTVHARHTLHGLERDLRDIPSNAARETAKIVRENAKDGNRRAKAFAKVSAGKHGKHYHRAFSAEAVDASTWVYGPDAGMPQGGMSFEYGSRNQRPHLDLNRSADIIGPKLAEDARSMLDGLFWP
jgi:hypothetical protein